jgi:predicted metal-binding membrane protein
MRVFLSPQPFSPSLFAGLMGAILMTWCATAWLMGGMDAGPGTPLGGFGWFVVSWILMMAAMMLPSEIRFALVFSQLSRDTDGGTARLPQTWLFLCGYLLTWTIYGVLAYLVDWSIRLNAPHFLSWDRQGPLIAGAVLIAAGAYQLSPLKQACLRHCISPVSFFMQRWRSGAFGAVRMGMEHGLLCIGCCWGLMLILFALGIMSLLWMSLLALLMFVEKVTPWGIRFSRPLAIALTIFGLWVAVAPETVPGLTSPQSIPHPMSHP